MASNANGTRKGMLHLSKEDSGFATYVLKGNNLDMAT